MTATPLTFDALLTAAAHADFERVAGAPERPKKSRRGRKPLAKNDKRQHCLSVRVNAQEQAQIDTKRGKLTSGEFLRLAGLNALPPAPPATLNREAWVELSRAAANLNQIAKALNSGDFSVEAGQALDALREFRFALIGAKLDGPDEPALYTK
jgi:hypothetical protein